MRVRALITVLPLAVAACGGGAGDTDAADAGNGGETPQAPIDETSPVDETTHTETEAAPTVAATRRETHQTTTESPWTPEEQEIIHAHEAAVEASLEAAAGPEPDPEHRALEETYTGDRLDRESATIEAAALNGTAFRYPDDKVHSVTYNSVTFDEVDGVEVAYVEVCTTTNWEEYVVETGKVLSRSGLRTTTATLTFHKVDGRWKVADTDHHNTDEGEAECVFD